MQVSDSIQAPCASGPAAVTAIRDWPESERPRERLLALGAAALSNAELLALLLGSGVRGTSAIDTARDALVHFGSLGALLNAPASALQRVPGWGDAASARVQAAIELARRLAFEQIRRTDVLDAPQAVRRYLALWLTYRDHEVFAVMFLDAQHRLIACEEMFRGSLTQTSVYPREVVRQALHHNCAAVILAHNHPSGVPEPSQADEALTRALQQALAMIDVRVLDHIVVAGSASTSFAERGLL
jgi:DNA repair protein RadC